VQTLAMKRFIQVALAASLLSVGLAMLVCGGRGFIRDEHSKTPVITDQEGAETIRMCPPTGGEIAEEFGVWLAVRKLACLAVAGAGGFMAWASCLSLLPNRAHA
jgi:hypothetical protein